MDRWGSTKSKSLYGVLGDWATMPRVRLAALVMVGIAMLLPYAPTVSMPSRDPGIYLYIGKEVLRGQVPYRDIWDNHPPGIYYIHALGLALAGGSRWGVWLVEVVALSLSVYLSFELMQRVFGQSAAVLGTGIWLLTLPFVLQDVGFIEPFALPLQFAVFYLFPISESGRHRRWPSFAIGMATAMSFVLKTNLLGAGLSVVTVIIWRWASERDWRRLATEVSVIALGVLSFLVPMAAYFGAHQALLDLYDCVFRYNSSYFGRNLTVTALAKAVADGMVILRASGIIFLGLAGWLAALLDVIRARGRSITVLPNLAPALLLGLPAEVLLVSMAGRLLYPHYLIPWLPVLGLLAAYYVYSCSGACCGSGIDSPPREFAHSPKWPLLVLVVIGLSSAATAAQAALANMDDLLSRREIVDTIARATTAEDYVLLWGAETGYNFLSNTRSPSRYVYQYPLFTEGYRSDQNILAFLEELRASDPKLIIDTSPSNPSVPPIDPSRLSSWKPPRTRAFFGVHPAMDKVFSHIAQHYECTGAIGPQAWPLYTRRID